MEQWRKQLVIDNEKLAYHGVKKYAKIKDDESKMVALEALTLSASKFDRTLGIKFSTFAMTLIQRRLYYHNMVRHEAYRHTINGEVKWVIPAKDSLDKIIQDSGNAVDRYVTLKDSIPAPEQDLDLKLDFERFCKGLSERERKILQLYSEGKTQTDIMKQIGVSQPHICRTIKSIYKKWQKYINKD